MEPLVSIIVPVFNREKYLDDCIKSLLQQTYKKIEVLLIDDASTDSSKDICQYYSDIDERVTLFPIEHSGVSGARNKGLDAAKGEFIMFCDSDDIVKETWVETYVSSLNEDVILSVSGFEGLESKVKILAKDSMIKEIDISSFLEYRQEWHMYSVCLCCFRNTNVRFMTSISKGEDSLFVLEYINSLNQGKIVYVPDTLYLYRQKTNMSLFASGKRDRKSYEANIKYLTELKERWGCSETVWNNEISALENEWFSEEISTASYLKLTKLMKEQSWNNYLNHLHGGVHEKIARLNWPFLFFLYLKFKKTINEMQNHIPKINK